MSRTRKLDPTPSCPGLVTANLTPHQLRQELRDGEAEAEARHRIGHGLRAAIEGFEDALAIGRRDARAAIVDRKRRDLTAVGDPQPDMAARREFDGIGQEVDENLPEPLLVGANHGRQVFEPRRP